MSDTKNRVVQKDDNKELHPQKMGNRFNVYNDATETNHTEQTVGEGKHKLTLHPSDGGYIVTDVLGNKIAKISIDGSVCSTYLPLTMLSNREHKLIQLFMLDLSETSNAATIAECLKNGSFQQMKDELDYFLLNSEGRVAGEIEHVINGTRAVRFPGFSGERIYPKDEVELGIQLDLKKDGCKLNLCAGTPED